MAATDFFTVEVWTLRGLVTYYVLFVMRLETRSVHIAGVTTAPNGEFMKQVVRNLTDVEDGFLLDSEFLIIAKTNLQSGHAFRSIPLYPNLFVDYDYRAF